MRTIFKLAVLLIALTSSITSFSQTSKGMFIISGSTGLQFGSNNVKLTKDGNTQAEYDESSFSFIPSAGYFVVDNLALGLSCAFLQNTTKYKNDNKNTLSSTLISPTLQYFFPIAGKLRPYVKIGLGYLSQTDKKETVTKYITTTSTRSSDGMALSLGGGISYFATRNISIDLGLLYTQSTLTDNDDDRYEIKQSNLGGSMGISLYF